MPGYIEEPVSQNITNRVCGGYTVHGQAHMKAEMRAGCRLIECLPLLLSPYDLKHGLSLIKKSWLF